MNKKNVLVMAVAMLLVAMISVGGTIAWLTATSGTVENTFTVGNITIKLDEADIDDTNKDGSTTDRDTTNSYKIIPGAIVKKDPTVTVNAGSEKCYVFVCVENNVQIEKDKTGANLTTPITVATCNINTEWAEIGTSGNKTVYVYGAADSGTVVDASAGEQKLKAVFETVKIDGDNVTEKNIDTLASDKITVNAYAHQSETAGYAAAKAAALAHFGIN